MPSFIIPCPKCKQELKADETLLGVDVDCPSCGAQMTVPRLEDLGDNTKQTDAIDADSSEVSSQPSADTDSSTSMLSPDTSGIEMPGSDDDIQSRNMSLKAFRESLKNRSESNAVIAISGFSEKLEREASIIRRILAP